MEASVIVITRNEAPRLALTLAALEATRADVIVVDDGSTDATREVIASARRPVTCVHHDRSLGRSAARNIGAEYANGDVLIFLDGDVLAAPDMVERHLALHAGGEPALGRGEQYHIRCTRFFHDPRTGTPMPDQEARVARMTAGELAKSLVTEREVRDDFASIERRAQVGIYPGAGPRLLAEVELAGLRGRPDSSVAWIAAAGHNFSVPRALFLDAGGFDRELSINEHRELALRLMNRGARVRVAEGARSYHLTHRVGWRDPLEDTSWEHRFWRKHPVPAVALLSIFWRSLAGDPLIPMEARLTSLDAFEAAARGETAFDYAALRRSHPHLDELPACESAR